MKATLTAIVRRSIEGYVASCAEIPGAEVVSATRSGALETLIEAVSIVLEVNRDAALKEAGRRAEHYRIEVNLDAAESDRLLELGENPA